jgi:hypothetical protein
MAAGTDGRRPSPVPAADRSRLVTIAGNPADTLRTKTWARIAKQAGLTVQD